MSLSHTTTASKAEPRRVSGRKKRLLRDNLNDGVVAQRKRRPNHNVPRDEAKRKYYEAGARVEIRDPDGGEPWGATVRSEEETLCYEINYDGYDKDELEWVPKDKIDGNFFVGSKVEIEDEDGGEPWGAAVRSVEEKCYAVNYDGYDSDELEWIPRDKILGVLYEVGSKVEIRDDDGGAPWGATIRRVKDAGYMINYDGP